MWLRAQLCLLRQRREAGGPAGREAGGGGSSSGGGLGGIRGFGGGGFFEAGQLQDEVSEILQSTQKQVRELEESVAGRRTLAQQLALEVAARDNEEAEMRAAKQKQMYKVAETSKEAYEEMRHSSTISSKLVKELQQVTIDWHGAD